MFDLDEAFSSEQSRLAQIANKCLSVGETETEADLEYFIHECGHTIGLNEPDARNILHAISLQLAEFKKLGQNAE